MPRLGYGHFCGGCPALGMAISVGNASLGYGYFCNLKVLIFVVSPWREEYTHKDFTTKYCYNDCIILLVIIDFILYLTYTTHFMVGLDT